MTAVAVDGGIERYDHLHIDKIDLLWKDRRIWAEGGLEAYRIAVELRDQLQLPVVGLGFSLEPFAGSIMENFQTLHEFNARLDWSPSLYVFHPDLTPYSETQKEIAELFVIRDLTTGALGGSLAGLRRQC